MKKFLAVVVIAFGTVTMAFSQESDELKLSISGEAKTGFFVWLKEKDVLDANDKSVHTGESLPDEGADIHTSDSDDWMSFKRLDSERGTNQGLYRLNFQIDKGNIGAKFRFEMSDFSTGAVNWAYAFMYGSFFNDQFRASAGKLGISPWGTAEADLDRELDNTVGMRFEYLPSFIPGLDVGVVLNSWNSNVPGKTTATINDLLGETVLGVSYTHEFFHARFAYRFDSEADRVSDIRDQGGKITYRLEERILSNFLPGLQVWNVGYFEEVGNKEKNTLTGTNYLFAQYNPDDFTARLRFGYDVFDLRRLISGRQADNPKRQWISVTPSFYYKFFNDLINAGLAFEIAKDFDGIPTKGSYLSWYIEPQVKVNIQQNFYVALVYRYHNEYYQLDITNGKEKNPEPFNSRTHWVNLRVAFTF